MLNKFADEMLFTKVVATFGTGFGATVYVIEKHKRFKENDM